MITLYRDYLNSPRPDLLRGWVPTSCAFSDPHWQHNVLYSIAMAVFQETATFSS